MKIPLLLKIEVQDIALESIKYILEKNSAGKAPLLLVLDKEVVSKREVFAKNCIEVLKEKGINPYFPYPCYIVSPARIETKGIPHLHKIEQAPKHFIKKIKRIKTREQGLLTKVDTYYSRIRNQSVDDDLDYIQRKREDNRKLRDLCHQKKFFISIVEKLREMDA